MKKNAVIMLILLCLIISCGKKTESQEKPNIKETLQIVKTEAIGDIDPIANPGAVQGGTFISYAVSFPKSLNMWLDYNAFSKEVTELMFENLASLHTTKNEPIGLLAESWTISDDKKVYTFKINPDARWSDGREITAEDIQFYYDVIMNPKNLTPIFRVELQRFDRPIVIDNKTIQIKANQIHWSNFWTAANLYALPKHVWENQDFNKLNFEFPVVSGPYRMAEVKKNRYITLEKREDWWGRSKKSNQYKYNFAFIKYKFIDDQNKALEAFKVGIFDALPVYFSSIWMKQTNFDAVKNGWVVKQRIFNQSPKSFQGFAINLRRPQFQDVRVRRALCHLINRRLMNEKLMFNQYFLLNSYYPDLYPNNLNPDVQLIEYDPEIARKLLKEAGWETGSDGFLAKDGKPFEITFVTNKTDLRHENVYFEDLKKVGIKASIEQLSLSSVRKRIDNHDFDLYWQNWNAPRLRDPEDLWHSSTADQIASNNTSGVKDAVIDSLIELQKTEMSLDRRNELLKKIDKRLNEIIPYILLWQADNYRLLYWNRFGTPEYIFDKFNGDESIVMYWWVDPQKEARLNDAMKKNISLEPKIEDIHYTE